MGKTVGHVRRLQDHELSGAEQFLAAARVHHAEAAAGFGLGGVLIAGAINTVSRARDPLQLKEHMIWAVTDARLVVWEADRLTTTKPKREPLWSAVFGQDLYGAAYRQRKKDGLLRVVVFDRPVTVKTAGVEGAEVFEVLREVKPPPPTAAGLVVPPLPSPPDPT
ncbi:MAG: hypothetical protein U0Q07_02370 [Acidimicrobiales bacterium]